MKTFLNVYRSRERETEKDENLLLNYFARCSLCACPPVCACVCAWPCLPAFVVDCSLMNEDERWQFYLCVCVCVSERVFVVGLISVEVLWLHANIVEQKNEKERNVGEREDFQQLLCSNLTNILHKIKLYDRHCGRYSIYSYMLSCWVL